LIRNGNKAGVLTFIHKAILFCSHDYNEFLRLTFYYESDAEQFHGRSIVLISHAYNLGFQNDTNRKCKLKISVTSHCSLRYWCVYLIQSTQLSALCNTNETSINRKNWGEKFYFWFSGSKELYIRKTLKKK